MKKEKVYFRNSSFIDFKGQERQFVLCGIRFKEEVEADPWNDSYIAYSVVFGISVCKPEDEFDLDLGRNIAKGRAKKGYEEDECDITSNMNYFTETIMNTLMDQEVEFIKGCPSKYLAGYDKQERKFHELMKRTEEIANLPITTGAAFDVLRELDKKEVAHLFELLK